MQNSAQHQESSGRLQRQERPAKLQVGEQTGAHSALRFKISSMWMMKKDVHSLKTLFREKPSKHILVLQTQQRLLLYNRWVLPLHPSCQQNGGSQVTSLHRLLHEGGLGTRRVPQTRALQLRLPGKARLHENQVVTLLVFSAFRDVQNADLQVSCIPRPE